MIRDKSVNIIALLVFSIGFSACITTTTNPPLSDTAAKPPVVSPSEVVTDYLAALKKGDFETAYDLISIAYAGNFDKVGYKINMRKELIENRGWSLLNYQVLGAQIFGSQSFVPAELEVRFKPADQNEVRKIIRIQYELAILNDEWKITLDKCIVNCAGADGSAGQGG